MSVPLNGVSQTFVFTHVHLPSRRKSRYCTGYSGKIVSEKLRLLPSLKYYYMYSLCTCFFGSDPLPASHLDLRPRSRGCELRLENGNVSRGIDE